MAVPPFSRFLRPALEAVSLQSDQHWRVYMNHCIAKLGLTEDDMSEVTPKTRKSRVEDRTEWALAYLEAAKLVIRSRPAHYVTTDRGTEFLANFPTEIRVADLLVFPEFVKFYRGTPVDASTKKTDKVDVELESTPLESIERASKDLRSALAQEVIEQLLLLSPARFEQVIVDLMLSMGYGAGFEDSGEVIGRSGDGGIDGLIRQDKLGLDTIYLQAKRWAGAVSSPEVNGFIGALTTRGATKGVMITTSTFTEPAKRQVAALNTVKISLIDGQQLAQLMINHELGVSTERIIKIHRIDSDYFATT